MQQTGKVILILGIVLIILGIIFYVFGDKLQWFGNLPGDIKIKKEHFSFYAPFATMLLLSIVISFIIWIISKIR
ncbi:MAG: DUF2905 domain-containing protein [Bacteroidales bacterium]|jgi:hypothetical protein|nr:DUF2905 domain-containing protein [Bacteroidales bacterium]